MVFNLESLNKSLNSLKNNSTIFLNSKIVNSFTQENKDFLNSKNIEIISLDINDKYDNTYLLRAFCKYFKIDKDIVIDALKEIFEKKGSEVLQKNLDIFNNTDIAKK